MKTLMGVVSIIVFTIMFFAFTAGHCADLDDFKIWESDFWVGQVWATDYYIDATAGSDSYAGTTTGAPWQTIVKVNAATLSGGDKVSFKRDESWAETLIPTISGTSGNRITYDAYGTGAKPTIMRVQLFGYDYIKLENLDLQASSASGNAIHISPGSYISVSNCMMDGNSGTVNHAAVVGGNATYCSDILFENCTFKDAGGSKCNLFLYDRTKKTTVRDCVSFNGGDNCMQVYSNAAADVCYDIVFEGNDCYDAVTNNGLEIGWYAYNVTARRNLLHDNKKAGLRFASAHDCQIYNNIFWGNDEEDLMDYDDVKGLGGYNHVVYNNVFDGRGKGLGAAKAVVYFENVLGTNTGKIFRNNIILADEALCRLFQTNHWRAMTISNNCWLNTAGYANGWVWNALTKTTFADWASASKDNDSFVADPLVRGVNGEDYVLLSHSPCIDAGIYTAGYDLDYRGRRIEKLRPDIGAYEFQKWVLHEDEEDE